MRSFFLQIFISFWLLTVVIFIAANTFAPHHDPGNPEQLRVALNTLVERVARPAIERYQKQGCAALAELSPGHTLADHAGTPLCANAFEPGVQAEIAHSGRRRKTFLMTEGHTMTQVTPFTGADGNLYFMVQRLPEVQRAWWPHLPPEAMPISILVTFVFAYFLTRPVRMLSHAFRRFSEGDMEVRLPGPPSRWKDFGGADVLTLMSDFNDMANRIRDLIEAQKLLVRDVSHELRSPLARLQVALGIAREEQPVSVETLDQASSEADRLNELIGELLTLSLLESTRQIPEQELFSLGEIFDVILQDMKFEAEANGASIAYASSCERFLLRGHSEMLRRAFENVIRNAIRYTPQGECIGIIAVAQDEQSAGNTSQRRSQFCEVMIEDRGPGVPPECLQKIFRPFYRVDMAREATTGGFGVGLAIAERAITLHGGSISVENRSDGGLRVRIGIPGAGE